MKLSDFAQGRDNNFNLLRISAAFAVLVTHSFALVVGSGDAEPFRKSLGVTLGSTAVDIFFVASGFLVTASLLVRQSAIEFIWARALRIFPALLVMLLLTVFGLGLLLTTLPTSVYLSHPKLYGYLLKCSTLVMGVAFSLPGVFEGNPWKNAINGSLWTLPYEVRMYGILVVVWLGLRVVKTNRVQVLERVIIVGAVLSGGLAVGHYFRHGTNEGSFTHLFFMFFSGAAFYVLKDRITLYRQLFWIMVAALAISTQAGKTVFFLVYMLTIAYMLFFVAYVPSGRIRAYNRLGDYSYGLYIYAFPVQQTLAALIPGISIMQMLLGSTVLTLLLAVLSWHLIERRALGLKGRYVGRTQQVFSRATARAPDTVR